MCFLVDVFMGSNFSEISLLLAVAHKQGRIFEFTRVDSELTRVDSIPFAISNVNKFNLSRFRLLIWVDSKLWQVDSKIE